jgi:tetratricopeptide (TPR) repeat protein
MAQSWVWGAAAGAGGLVLVAGIGVGVLVNSAVRGPRPAIAAIPTVARIPATSEPAAVKQSTDVATAHGGPRTGELPPDVLFAHASPSVVRIVTRDEDFRVMGFGSGFFVSQDGLIVTNYHVIRGAIFAGVVRSDNSTLFVEGLLASDPKADLALLKVTGSGFPVLPVGDVEPPKIGTKVFAIGNPEGFTNSLSEGLISGVREWSEGVSAVQTTAPISHGSSGGPLMSADGTVVGVTAASRVDGQSLNFAIAASAVRKLIDSQGDLHRLASAGMAPLTPEQTKAFNGVWKALDQKQYDDARQKLDDLRADHLSDPIFWLARGQLENAEGREGFCIPAYQKAIKLDPKFQPAWTCLGLAYAKYKHYDAAIDALESARGLNPDSPIGWDLEGMVYAMSGRMEKSLECYQKAVRVVPDDVLGLAGCGHAFCALRYYSDAVSPCKKAISLRPGYARPYVDLGVAYSRLGRIQDASDCWRTAARLDPNGPAGQMARLLLIGPPPDALLGDPSSNDAAQQHQAAVDGVGRLHLQSVGHYGEMMRCRINGFVYNEGDLVDGFTIEKIRATGVIVRKGGYRFQITQANGASGG